MQSSVMSEAADRRLGGDEEASLPEVDRQPPHLQRVSSMEREAVRNLPQFHDRVHMLGYYQEYRAYRDRYVAWHNPDRPATGGEPGTFFSPSMDVRAFVDRNRNRGFRYWYPSMADWMFRRTLSYWIAVTFFEGSIFFTTSSFLSNYPDELGQYFQSMTTFGYVAGKINYFVCTWFMCLETVNLTAEEHTSAGSPHGAAENRAFSCWPFHCRTALENLEKLGAGPYPYYASVVYFIGVNTFLVGLIAEFLPLPELISKWTVLITFLLGSIFFVLGGLAECKENKVFSTLSLDIGRFGAIMNTLGGLLFLVGSVLGFWDASHAKNLSFGVGSAIFLLGSGVMIIMWKDEQFGLTFLSALNGLDRATPIQSADGSEQENSTFSVRGSFFVMLYCFAASVSVYNFFVSMRQGYHSSKWSCFYVLERSFNALLPAIFTHALLLVNSAVIHVPKTRPFYHLFIGCRFLALLMTLSGSANLVETLMSNHS